MITYDGLTKNARLKAVIDSLDAAFPSPGTLEILDVGNSLMAVIPLQSPSFTVSDQQMTLNGTPLSALATADGTATAARFRDGNGSLIIDGLTVATVAPADIIMDTVTLKMGDTVSVASGTIVHG